MIDTVRRGDGSQLQVAGNPIKLSGVEAHRSPDDPAPVIARPGQHTWEVRHHELGMLRAEFDALVADGIVAGDSLSD